MKPTHTRPSEKKGSASRRISHRQVPEPLIDSDQAAAIIGIHPKTLQRYARHGLIRGIHVGKLWRFRASEIDDWIAREYAG